MKHEPSCECERVVPLSPEYQHMGLTGGELIGALATEGAYNLTERKMGLDWTKLFNVGMVQSFLRWIMTVWGSTTFMMAWITNNPTDWSAMVAGMVAAGALLWSFMTVTANK